MKAFLKILPHIYLLFLSIGVFSQNFIDETKQWTIVSQLFESTDYFTSIYQFSGDSVHNGKTYHKLYESDDLDQENWNFNSLWYENNDSIYKHNYLSNQDDLIYDFNIDVGDTFVVDNLLSLRVDSITDKNWGGSSRKHLYLSRLEGHSPTTTVWIEGIGQTGYFVRSTEIDITGASVELLCLHKNGNLIYQNPEFNSCYVSTSIPTIKKKQNLVEVNNTCGNLITVKPLSSSLGIIEVYTITGHKIITKKMELTGSTVKLPSNGVFIYRVTTLTGDTQTGKVVVR